jgi:hypothetical protein
VLSSLHLERYLEAAERLVDKIVNIPAAPPAQQRWRIVLDKPAEAPLRTGEPAWHDGLVGRKPEQIFRGRIPLLKLPKGRKISGYDPGPQGLLGPVRPGRLKPRPWERRLPVG